ncbi:MAG: hypothetical protein HZB53_14925 [Chloroflexi bacterium]|nr:hypothetical protein [Chloroflexota bacterium]
MVNDRPALAPMRRWRDPLAVAALLLVGLHPFSYTSLAASFDGLLHLYRLVELDHLLRQGEWYPRWAPDFVFGFGYPIFNFYAPLAYYLSALVHAFGVTYADTATLFFIACTLAGAWAMYALALNLSGSRHGALVAALAYGYAPTHIYDNFYRSAWGTVLAFALAPFLLWALHRWHCEGHLRHLVAATLGAAALMLAHNVSALLLMPVAGTAAVSYVVFAPSEAVRIRLLRAAGAVGALAVGLGLSAFFWLPAISETAYVQTWRLVIPPDFDFRTHFLSVADWFAWPAPAEIGRINPDLVNTLGPVQCLLAVAGMGLLLRHSVMSRQRATPLGAFLFIALFLAGSLWMTLPSSLAVWEGIALLPSLQFPHRFLTIAALSAPLLGAFALAQAPLRWRGATAATVIVALVLSALPFLYPRPQPATNPEPGLADMLAHEHRTGALGTTASGEYLPVWVKFVPRNSAFEEAIANGENPQRFESRSLPAGSKVLSQQVSALASALTISATQPFTATFRQFFFPGWQAYIDDQPVVTTASEGQGLTVVAVPSGTHTVTLRFTSTAVRDAAAGLSMVTALLSALFLATMAVLRRSRASKATTTANESGSTRRFDELPGPEFFAALGIVLFVFKIGIVDRANTPFRVAFDGLHIHTLQYPKPVSSSCQARRRNHMARLLSGHRPGRIRWVS